MGSRVNVVVILISIAQLPSREDCGILHIHKQSLKMCVLHGLACTECCGTWIFASQSDIKIIKLV